MLRKIFLFGRPRVLFCVLCLLSCLSFFWFFRLVYEEAIQYEHKRFGEHNECKHGFIKNMLNVSRAKKLILFYTTIFDRYPVFYPEKLKCCEPFDCEITTDKSRILQSDAVIFHGRDMPTAEKMPLKQRTAKQRWLFYTMESPLHSNIKPENYNGMFNWTMTYERRADIYQPYGYYTKRFDDAEYVPRNYASGKDKLLAYVNGHCKTNDGLRESYLRALNKIVKLEVHGKCGGIFGRLTCPRKSKKCSDLLKRYKFYISFENSICNDYVSEKYWIAPFDNDIVPIVFGLKFFKELAIPGSYIDAMQFEDLGSLVKYLKYLDSNDTAYNEYFKWKQVYQLASLEPWPCRLCQMLHNDSLPAKTYGDFGKFLDPQRTCTTLSKNIIKI